MNYLSLVFTFSYSILPVYGIIGGTVSRAYSFFVMVLKDDGICGGTIVGDDLVLTAASCLYYQDQYRWALEKEVFIRHGNFSVRQGWKGKTTLVQEYKVNAQYSPNPNGDPAPFDIALIKVRPGLGYHGEVPRVCLKRNYNFGFFIGLGLTHQNPDLDAGELMQAVLLWDDSCGRYGQDWLFLRPELQTCYHAPPKASVCHGDLGGPLFYKRNDEVICIMGVASYHHKQCDKPGYPAVFTRTSKLGNWIKRQKRHLSSRKLLI